MTTPSKVNKKLAELNIKGSIYRGNGYYYFIGELFDIVPTIYQNSLRSYTTKEIIDHVKKHFNN